MDSSSPSPGLPVITTAHLGAFLPAAMDSTVDHGRLEHIQLAPGRFSADLVRIHSGTTRFDWGSYNLPVHAHGDMPADRITLGLVQSAHGDGILNGRGLQHAQLALYTEGSELDYRLATQTSWSALQVDRATLDRLGVHCPPRQCGIVTATPAATSRVAQLSELLVAAASPTAAGDDPSGRDFSVQGMLQGLLAAYATALPQALAAGSHCATGRQRLAVSRARDFLHGHFNEAIRVTDLCAAAGTSVKTLERAFVTLLGVTPQRYLMLARLSHASRMLLAQDRAETTVAAVAYASGVFSSQPLQPRVHRPVRRAPVLDVGPHGLNREVPLLAAQRRRIASQRQKLSRLASEAAT